MVHYTILAQTPQFNKLYNTDSTRELSPCVLPTTDEGYIVGGVKIVNEWRNIVSLFPEKCFVKNA